jgi:hypothetical protein
MYLDLNILDSWKTLLEIVTGILMLVGGAGAFLWGYAKFVLERGFLPPVQSDIECRTVGAQGEKLLLEVLLHHKNIGSSTLVEMNIRVDLLTYYRAAFSRTAVQDRRIIAL